MCCGGGGGGGTGRGEEVDLSLACHSQMLMARRLRTSIAVTEDMLKPQLNDPKEVLPKLKERGMGDGEVVSVREGNKWKSAGSVSQVLPSSRPYKVETARGGGYRRNHRHLLRTEETQIPEITPTPDVSNDEDLTDTKVEPSSVTVAHENPGSPPAGKSVATTTRSDGTVREAQRLKDYNNNNTFIYYPWR